MRKDFVCPHARNCHLASGKEAEKRCCCRGARQRRIASAARHGARWHGPAFPGGAQTWWGSSSPGSACGPREGSRRKPRSVPPEMPSEKRRPASSGEGTTRGQPCSGGLLFHPWELDRVHRSCAPNSVTSTRKTKWQ